MFQDKSVPWAMFSLQSRRLWTNVTGRTFVHNMERTLAQRSCWVAASLLCLMEWTVQSKDLCLFSACFASNIIGLKLSWRMQFLKSRRASGWRMSAQWSGLFATSAVLAIWPRAPGVSHEHTHMQKKSQTPRITFLGPCAECPSQKKTESGECGRRRGTERGRYFQQLLSL